MSEDLPIPSLAAKFNELFQGHPEIHGASKLTGERKDNGKVLTTNGAVHKPLDQRTWEQHLKGERSIGVFPLRPDGTVLWAAIDLDIYNDPKLCEKLPAFLEKNNLPFVPCRSKSGGIHLYWFFSEPVDARAVINKLRSFAAHLGQADAEIFPKQGQLGTQNEGVRYGNWMNSPYDGPNSMRYAIHNKDSLSATEFVNYAEVMRTTKEQMIAFEPPKQHTDPLPEGPPCLNTLVHTNIKSKKHRNDTLFNVALYYKKTESKDVLQDVKNINAKFNEPLDVKEVETAVASALKDDYNYGCNKKPMCDACDSHLCASRKYGVGETATLLDPNNQTLIQVNSSPPVWYITIDDKTIPLATEEFDSYTKFQRRVLEVTLIKLPVLKPDAWVDLQRRWLSLCTRYEVPEEATPLGQLKTMLWEFSHAATDDEKAFAVAGSYSPEATHELYFKLQTFQDFLERRRFKALKPHEVISALRKSLHVDNTRKRINDRVERCWKADLRLLEDKRSPATEELHNNPI